LPKSLNLTLLYTIEKVSFENFRHKMVKSFRCYLQHNMNCILNTKLHKNLSKAFAIIIINEYPEAGLTASISIHISIVNTNYNKNFTNTIITL